MGYKGKTGMPYKDKTKQQEYLRDLMRRRRAEPQQQGNLNSGQVKTSKPTAEVKPADRRTTKPQDQGKCFWSDMNVCILYLSPEGKPIYCNGYKKACEGSLEDIKTLPFGPSWKGFKREA